MRLSPRSPLLIAAISGLAIAAAACGGTAANQQSRSGGRGSSASVPGTWKFKVAKHSVRLVAPPPPARVTREAVRIASHDLTLRHLLGNSRLHVQASGDWTSV